MPVIRVPEQESPVVKKSRKKSSRFSKTNKGAVAKKSVAKKRSIFGPKDADAAGKATEETSDKPADKPQEKNTEVGGQRLACRVPYL